MQRVSAIVSTHNRSEYLRLCIASLEAQSVRPHEVIVADDGSGPDHVRAIRQIMDSSSLKVIHARQEDRGFRLAAARNNGVHCATGDYLFFTDCDVVLFPDCLGLHLAAGRRGHWATGHDLRLTQEETSKVTEELARSRRLEELWPGPSDTRCVGLRKRARRQTVKAMTARLWPSEHRLRQVNLIGMQASMPRAAFEAVNGFDETFEGWGWEDLDLGLRLQLAGFRGHNVVAESRALHLFHEPAACSSANREYYQRSRNGEYRCKMGLSQ